MKRLWGISHVRYWWHRRQAIRWVRMWADAGLGLGELNPHDEAVLRDIWEGRY